MPSLFQRPTNAPRVLIAIAACLALHLRLRLLVSVARAAWQNAQTLSKRTVPQWPKHPQHGRYRSRRTLPRMFAMHVAMAASTVSTPRGPLMQRICNLLHLPLQLLHSVVLLSPPSSPLFLQHTRHCPLLRCHMHLQPPLKDRHHRRHRWHRNPPPCRLCCAMRATRAMMYATISRVNRAISHQT